MYVPTALTGQAEWRGLVRVYQVAYSLRDARGARYCDTWFHLKTQVPAKPLAKRGETDTLKIGNNWLNITQTSNCNLPQEQYSFQRSKHFLNICAICSPSRQITSLKVTYLEAKLCDVLKVHTHCKLITQTRQHISF